MHSYHDPNELETIGQQLVDIMKSYYSEPECRSVIKYKTKSAIIEAFHHLHPPENGQPMESVIERFRQEVLPHSVQTWHPLFLNQMFAGASFPSIVGDLLASMMNPTLATWEMSPVATLIEQNVAQWMAELLGMVAGSGGIFLPGGTISNLLALTIARNRFLSPDIADRGLHHQPQGAILCSEASHYSIASAANLLGIGKDFVYRVKVNKRQEMDVQDLQSTLNRCELDRVKPFAVVATTGITVTGGFDPVADIAEVLHGRDIHLHVDAAFGGGLAFSNRGRDFFKGIQAAHSVSWDAHKWMHTPLTCSVLLVPDPEIFRQTFSLKADYLFHPQDDDLLRDLGTSTILCGKRFDALKIWLLWNTYGTQYFRDLANERIDIMEQLNQHLAMDPDFVTDYQMVSPILCFRYCDERMRELPENERTEFSNRLHRRVREDIKYSGQALFNITKLNGIDQFRMVFINPLTEFKHLTTLLETVRERCRAYSDQPR